MKKEAKISLQGLIVVTFVIGCLILLLLPALRRMREISNRVICGTNLKGLGSAMMVYANDYGGDYPQLPGEGPWSKRLGFDYDHAKPDFSYKGAEGAVSRTITASLYLLVREADLSPKSFLCPRVSQKKLFETPIYTEFSGQNTKGLDVTELWDFGHNPYSHVSYAYHNPYGRFPADGSRSAAFVVMADMNPWFKYGDIVKTGSTNQPPQLLTISDSLTRGQIKNSNASHHEYEGQNVLYADGHTASEKQSNVGVNNDNIYTFWSTEDNPTEQDKQGGTAPTSRSPENDAKSSTDSFLAI